MVSSRRPAAYCRRRHGSFGFRLATGSPSQCSCASIGASITVSPTVIRAPPISAGSTLTDALDLLAETPLQRGLELRDLGVGQRERAVDPRRATPSASSFSVVEQRRDLRQRRRRDRPRPARERSGGPAASSLSPQIDSSSDFLVAGGEPRVVERARHRRIGDHAREKAQHLRPHRQRVATRAQAGTPPRRRAWQSSSVRPSRFRLELLPDRRQQVGVRLGVDFALQDLRGAGDGKIGDLAAQRFLRAGDLLADLGLRGGEDAVGLGLGLGLGGVDRLALELLALRDDLGAAASSPRPPCRRSASPRWQGSAGPPRRRRCRRRSASAACRSRASAAARRTSP